MAAGDMKNTTPAVLLYYEDFLAGTADMTDEEVGQYIRLLCYQNAKGHLADGYIKRIMPNALAYVLEKFQADEDGAVFNRRMESEIERRVKYSKSRAENRKKKEASKISNTHVPHMETETETETVNRNKSKRKELLHPEWA